MRKSAVIAGLLVVGLMLVISRGQDASQAVPQKIVPDDPLVALGGTVARSKAEAVASPSPPAVSEAGTETVTPAAFAPDAALEDQPNDPPPVPRRLYVTGSSVNVRDGATAKAAKLGKLTRGTAVTVLEETDGWIRIAAEDGSGLSGWMSADFLGDAAPAALVAAPEPEPRTREVAAPSGAEIRVAAAEIIRRSIGAYPGPCACPYNTDSAGRRCGGRSAWSKPGGYAPVCYESDVSAALLDSYFARLRGAVD